MFKEFREFISSGSVVDLAVGVIIGSAFSTLVTALTTYILNPLIGLLIGRIDLTDMKFTVFGANFLIGDFINSIINFLIVMFVIFIVVRSMNKFRRDGSSSKFDNEPETDPQLEYLQQIRDLLRYQSQQQNNHRDRY